MAGVWAQGAWRVQVRLVSGFLDKMVVHPELRPPPDANLTEWSEPGHDWWNLRVRPRSPHPHFSLLPSATPFVHMAPLPAAGSCVCVHLWADCEMA